MAATLLWLILDFAFVVIFVVNELLLCPIDNLWLKNILFLSSSRNLAYLLASVESYWP